MIKHLMAVFICSFIGTMTGQFLVMPFGLQNWSLAFGMCLGATFQAFLYMQGKSFANE